MNRELGRISQEFNFTNGSCNQRKISRFVEKFAKSQNFPLAKFSSYKVACVKCIKICFILLVVKIVIFILV